MKSILFLFLISLSFSTSAQYYYKDIIGTRETSEIMKTYVKNGVNRVLLTSYDADNTKSDNFFVMQEFIPSLKTLKTTTKTGEAEPSVLLSWIDANGNVIKTLDSSSSYVSATTYNYNNAGQLISLLSTSYDSARKNQQSEEHIWYYEGNRISKMVRIKNKIDSTAVHFKFDEQGNVIEEQETRKGVQNTPVYYYYDKNNRLTDIVRYSPKAKRLLPEYMFEYSPVNQVIQKITVPANSDKYLIWRYQYNAQGLKIKEVIYDKNKDLSGKVEYQYSFAN
ncbi:MAG: hypothetical protein H0U44_05635 [Flavisolibacter sp.]|nr:hypothetical protein [Flavisolibacter sp.]